MTEIEKMYENVGIETNKYKLCCTGCKHIARLEVINGYPSEWICDKYDEISDCDKAEPDYPPFTAEKQLELIKWLAVKGDFDASIDIAKNTYDYWTIYFQCERWTAEGFEETLAGLINNLWQDLTDQEKEEIRGILND